MNDKDWQILLTLYEEKNITKASERLFISQPALTYRINQLEKEFKVSIISRNTKGVKFTLEGEHLVEYSKNMLLQLRKTKDSILNMSGDLQGNLKLGAASNFAHYKLPPILKSFLAHYNNQIQVHVSTGWSSHIFGLLQNEKIDVGIVRGDYTWYEQKILVNEETLCVVSNKELKFDQLPDLPRIYYRTDPMLENEIEKWWSTTFLQPPQITMKVDKIETCKEMVVHGLGYAIIPRIYLKPSDDLYAVDLMMPNGEPVIRKTWLICRDRDLELNIVGSFVSFFKENYLHEGIHSI